MPALHVGFFQEIPDCSRHTAVSAPAFHHAFMLLSSSGPEQPACSSVTLYCVSFLEQPG